MLFMPSDGGCTETDDGKGVVGAYGVCAVDYEFKCS